MTFYNTKMNLFLILNFSKIKIFKKITIPQNCFKSKEFRKFFSNTILDYILIITVIRFLWSYRVFFNFQIKYIINKIVKSQFLLFFNAFEN